MISLEDVGRAFRRIDGWELVRDRADWLTVKYSDARGAFRVVLHAEPISTKGLRVITHAYFKPQPIGDIACFWIKTTQALKRLQARMEMVIRENVCPRT